MAKAQSAGVDMTSRAPADRWSVFRGSLRMTGISASELPENPAQVWFVETTESIEATAAIAGGVVFVPSMSGSCFALKLENGDPVWKFSNPDKDPAKSSPVVTENHVLYGDDIGKFRALNRATGKLVWEFDSEGEIICSPTVIKDKVIFGSYDETLYCLDEATGKALWRVKTQGPVHCSPSLAGDQVVVAGCDGFVRLLRLLDGKETSSIEIGGNIASTPAVDGNFLYFGTMSNEVIKVDWTSMTKVWRFESPKRRFPFYSSPAIAGNFIVIGGRDKVFRALDQESGEERWALSTGGRIDSSPVVVGSVAYIGSSDGNVYGADIKSGEKRWEYPTGSAILASPAVAAGHMVIGAQDGTIYCFGVRPK